MLLGTLLSAIFWTLKFADINGVFIPSNGATTTVLSIVGIVFGWFVVVMWFIFIAVTFVFLKKNDTNDSASSSNNDNNKNNHDNNDNNHNSNHSASSDFDDVVLDLDDNKVQQ